MQPDWAGLCAGVGEAVSLCCFSHTQAFPVQDDSKRSPKFSTAVPLYRLRGLLGISDVEELASSTARAIQVREGERAGGVLQGLVWVFGQASGEGQAGDA